MKVEFKEGWTTDYTGRCGNCQEFLDINDKYCRKCGTKRGNGAFEPYYNELPCDYGSPRLYEHICENCGNKFSESTVGTGAKYCALCGTKLKTVEHGMFG